MWLFSLGDFVEKKGAWIKPVDDFKELLDSKNLEFPDKIQGDNNLFKTIEGDRELCLFLIDYFKEQISAWSLLIHTVNKET